MAISETDSQRLRLLRFPLILGVVYIHSYDTSLGLSGGAVGVQQVAPAADFVRNLVSQGLARTAVPLFFVMSGFFLAYGAAGPWAGYGHRLRSRLTSLLLPFLIWNLLTLGLYALAQSLPATSGFLSGRQAVIAQLGPAELLSTVLGIGRMPIAYQFWFIRDLMLLVVVSPLVMILMRAGGRAAVALLVIAWLADLWPLYAPSLEAVVFFGLGVYAGLVLRTPFVADRQAAWLLAAYAVVVLIDAAIGARQNLLWFHRAGVVLGVAAVLGLTQWVVRCVAWRERLLALAAASFFVFAAHEPLLTVFRKLAFKVVLPSQSVSVIVLYLLIPCLVAALLTGLYFGLRAVAPRVVAVLSGGR